MATKASYTAEQSKQVFDMSQAGHTAEQIAAATGRTLRSIVAKLASEGLYKPEKTTKVRTLRKSDFIVQIATAARIEDTTKLESLAKADLPTLKLLAEALSGT